MFCNTLYSNIQRTGTGVIFLIINNRYTIIRKIGEGGSGTVYIARDTVKHNRRIALKKLNPGIVNDKKYDSIKNEFKSLTRLHHPNLIKIFDLGIIKESGELFLSMEFLEGKNLLEISQSITATELMDILIQICRALDYIHSKGVIHNDIKPENIFILSQNNRLVVKIMDFGLASSTINLRRGIGGTLFYTAPEILQGHTPDAKADLYALGILLYRISYGKFPFPTEIAADVIHWHISGEPLFHDEPVMNTPPFFPELISLLLQKDPSKRLGRASKIVAFMKEAAGSNIQFETRESMESYFKHSDCIGRNAEMNRILDTIELIQDPILRKTDPYPILVVIAGESGVGKSRLLEEIKNRCQLEGLDIATGHCYEEGTPPYGPFREILGTCLSIARSIEETQKEGKSLFTMYLPIVQHFLSTPEKSGPSSFLTHQDLEREKLKLIDTLAEFLSAVSACSPLILTIEDLQWSDASTLFMLEFLARNSGGKRLLLITTVRSEDARQEPISTFLGKTALMPMTEKIELHPLKKEEVAELLSSMTGIREGIAPLAARIFKGTDGNPLFIEEVMKSIAEDVGAEYEADWQKKVLQYQENIMIPSSIKGVLDRRLGRLDPLSLDILQILALIERPSPLSLIERSVQRDLSDIETIMESLASKGIVKIENNGERSFFLGHNVIKRHILEAIPAIEKKKLHGQIGYALLELMDHDASSDELAHHFVSAGNQENAVRFSLKAAERASTLYAHERAVQHYRNALHYIHDDPIEQRIEVLLNLAASLLDAGAIEDGISCYEEVAETSEAEGLDAPLALALERLGWAHSLTGKLDVGKEYSEKALKQYENSNDRTGMAKALNNLGFSSARMGFFQDALDCFMRSLQIWNELNDSFHSINLINNIGLVHYHMGDLDESEKLLQRALDESNKHDHKKMIVASLNNLGIVYKKLNLRTKAIASYEQCLSLEEEMGDKFNIAKTYHNLGELFKTSARYENSIFSIRRAIKIIRYLGEKKEEAFSLDCLGNVYQLMGSINEAQHCHERALSLSRELSDQTQQAYSLLSLSGDSILDGDIEKARQCIRKAVKISDKLENKRIRFKGLIRSMSLSNAEGKFESTLRNYNAFEKITGKGALDIEDTCEARLLYAEALIQTGRRETAQSVLEEIMQDTEEQDLKEHAWRACYRLAFIAEKEKRVGDAKKLSAEAKQIVQEIAAGIRDRELRERYMHHPDRKHLFDMLEKSEKKEETADMIQGGGMKTPPLKMLTTLYEIVQMINSILDPDELLEKLMDLTIDVVGAERGLIILIDENTGDMSVSVARNIEKETIKDASLYSHSIVKQAGAGRSILTLDALNDERFKKSKSVSLYNIRSLMCVPLKIKERVIGTVYLDSRSSGPLFSSDDLSFVEALANHAAIAIEKAHLYAKLKRENKLLKDVAHERYRFDNIIGKSTGMKKVFSTIERIMDSVHPVLIIGESGTGKELVARAIHFNGPRKNNIFLSENCSAISETLLESELFGHMRGAFTGAINDRKGLFEIAKDGTLFLDEIGDMSLSMQGKLLRAIQEGEIRPIGSKRIIKVNPRIISASNQDIKRLIDERKFREDLYYRLNVLQITIPPLRERREDIPLLVDHFLKKAAGEKKVESLGIDEEVLNLFLRYRWPGNVRELENAVNRLSLIASRNYIDMEAVKSDKDLFSILVEKLYVSDAVQDRTRTGSLKDKEREMIISALEESEGNRGKAAKILGVSRATIFRKMKQHNIS